MVSFRSHCEIAERESLLYIQRIKKIHFQSLEISGSEVTEDADIGKLLPVTERVEAQQEGPLHGHETPHTGQVETLWICERLMIRYG